MSLQIADCLLLHGMRRSLLDPEALEIPREPAQSGASLAISSKVLNRSQKGPGALCHVHVSILLFKIGPQFVLEIGLLE